MHEAFALGKLTGGSRTGRQALVVVYTQPSHTQPHALHVGTAAVPITAPGRGTQGKERGLRVGKPDLGTGLC